MHYMLVAVLMSEVPWWCGVQTSVQVPSPAAGVIEELLVPDGGRVEGGTPLFKLKKGGTIKGVVQNSALVHTFYPGTGKDVTQL